MQINECLNVSCPKSRQSFERGAAPAGRVGRGGPIMPKAKVNMRNKGGVAGAKS